jgi:hypothetical protein
MMRDVGLAAATSRYVEVLKIGRQEEEEKKRDEGGESAWSERMYQV